MMFNVDNNELKRSRQGVFRITAFVLLDISNSRQIPIKTLSSQQSLNFEKPNEIE